MSLQKLLSFAFFVCGMPQSDASLLPPDVKLMACAAYHLGCGCQTQSICDLAQAYFRGARAATRLHEYAAAVKLAQDGLKIDNNATELKQMLEVRQVLQHALPA